MFSFIIDFPSATLIIAVKIGCASVGKPGYILVETSIAFSLFGALNIIELLLKVTLHPVYFSLYKMFNKSNGFTLSNFTNPFVIAPMHKYVPVSILSGIIL